MIEVVAGVVRRADGGMLIARRKPDAHEALKWEFPGGKIEPRETPQAALARELTEELGICVRAGRLLLQIPHASGGRELRISFYEAELISGEPQPIDNGGFCWILPEEAGAFDFAPADAEFLRRMRETGGLL